MYYLRVLDDLAGVASALLTCEWAAATTSCCDTTRSGSNMECHRRTDGQAPSDERAAWIPRELRVAGIILCNHSPCLVSSVRRGRTTSKALSKSNNAFSLPHFTASLVGPGPLHVRHGVLEAAPCSCHTPALASLLHLQSTFWAATSLPPTHMGKKCKNMEKQSHTDAARRRGWGNEPDERVQVRRWREVKGTETPSERH